MPVKVLTMTKMNFKELLQRQLHKSPEAARRCRENCPED